MADVGRGVALAADGTVIVVGSGPLSLGTKEPLSTGGGAFLVRLNPDKSPPSFTRQSVTNGANFVSGLVAPGGIASIFCTDLTGVAGVQRAIGFPLPTDLAGVTVKINGVAAPLFSVSGNDTAQQINLQVPFEAFSANDVYEVEVSQGSISAWVNGLHTRSTPPGLFKQDGVYGVIQHASDYSTVTPA
jgi:uncharacterized protein (TIGR03437 family)